MHPRQLILLCHITMNLKMYRLFDLHNVSLYSKITLPSSACPPNSDNAKGRLPGLTAWYEGLNTPDLFVLGTAAHSRDYRLSAGGFVHGFRYTGKSQTKAK